MAVPQDRNQKKHKHKSKLRTYYPAVRGWRLEDEAEAKVDNWYRPGDRLGEMLLNRPRLEDMLSRDPMSFLDKPRSFLDLAETTDPDEADLEDFFEDFDGDFDFYE